jgi:putative ABC transport system permease protein
VASNVLVISQLTAAMVLVAGSSLLIRSFVTAMRVDPGVRTDGVLTSGITLPRTRYDEARQHQFFLAALDSLRAVPGVRAAAVGTLGPLQGAIPVDVSLDPGGQSTGSLRLNGVSTSYMELLSIPVLAGRNFERHDDQNAERVMILSRLAGTRLFPDGSLLGRTVYKDGEPWRVIGVVEDVRQEGLLKDLEPVAYAPFHQYFLGAGTFVVVGSSDPASLANSFRQVIRRLDPDLAVDRIETLASVIDESLAQPRFYAVTVGVFGALALGLAVAGLYVVIAFAARRRVYEFGVRSALGARPRDNLWLVYRQGLVLSVAGVAVGGLLAFNVTQVLGALLFRTEPTDPVLLGLAAAITLVTALAACMIPALRASRVDPVVALKSE